MFKIALNDSDEFETSLHVVCSNIGFGENLDLINEQTGSIKNLATLLEFDSIHGHWTNNIETEQT